jgi:uncharacterized protein (TIGR02466 family)
MNRPKGDVHPIFPAAAIVRYQDTAHEEVSLDGLEFLPAAMGSVRSTSQALNVLHQPRFARLRLFLEDCVRDYLDNVYGYRYESFDIIHAWVNQTPVGGFQPMHYHGNSVVSGVYYLQADPDKCSPLFFDKPELNTQPYIAVASGEQNLLTANRVAYPVATGLACLFPSQLRHGYEVATGAERISLAFNVMLAGIGMFYKL